MKLKSPTILLVSAAAALGAFVAVTQLQTSNQSESDESQLLFGFEEEAVQSLTVETSDQTLVFEKEGEQWQMRSPDESPASKSSVVFLVNLMASGRSDRVFEVNSTELVDFGLTDPLAEVEVVLENDDTHRLILGNYDFNRSAIYAQTLSAIADSNSNDGDEDKKTEDEGTEDDGPDLDNGSEPIDVFVVSTSFDTAVNRPMDDWKVEDVGEAEEAEGAEDAEAEEVEKVEESP